MARGTQEPQIPDKLFFKIGEVAKLTGTKPHVLRYWESEFRVLRPAKGDSGQRVYRRKDVRLVFRIKQLLYEENFTIAGAKKQLQKQRTARPDAERAADETPPPQTPEPHAGTADVQGVDLAWVRRELGEILGILGRSR